MESDLWKINDWDSDACGLTRLVMNVARNTYFANLGFSVEKVPPIVGVSHSSAWECKNVQTFF